jgi:hypothetical protein
MSEYYVTHPGIDVTATVEAPSTEKARTTFLDYLERHGIVDRKYRQTLRGNMAAKKVSGEIRGDIDLHYGYEESVQPQFLENIPISEEPIPTPIEEQPKPRMSPLARASLGIKEGEA